MTAAGEDQTVTSVWVDKVDAPLGSVQQVVLRHLIPLSQKVDEIVGQMVQIDQDVIDGWSTQQEQLAQNFETCATALATEINNLLTAAANAGVTLPQANVDGVTQALADTTQAYQDLAALETPQPAPAPPAPPPPAPTPAPDPTPTPTPPAPTPSNGGPSVTGLSPANGSVNGGDTVVIAGAGFTGATAVNFGTSAATSFLVQDDATIQAVTPSEAAGAVDVTVVGSDGSTTSPVSGADQFTFA